MGHGNFSSSSIEHDCWSDHEDESDEDSDEDEIRAKRGDLKQSQLCNEICQKQEESLIKQICIINHCLHILVKYADALLTERYIKSLAT
jgi:hypothetical protein